MKHKHVKVRWDNGATGIGVLYCEPAVSEYGFDLVLRVSYIEECTVDNVITELLRARVIVIDDLTRLIEQEED